MGGWVCTFVRICVSVHTWTAGKNDILKGLNFKPTGFLVVC